MLEGKLLYYSIVIVAPDINYWVKWPNYLIQKKKSIHCRLFSYCFLTNSIIVRSHFFFFISSDVLANVEENSESNFTSHFEVTCSHFEDTCTYSSWN